jgi:hypothetical protein
MVLRLQEKIGALRKILFNAEVRRPLRRRERREKMAVKRMLILSLLPAPNDLFAVRFIKTVNKIHDFWAPKT